MNIQLPFLKAPYSQRSFESILKSQKQITQNQQKNEKSSMQQTINFLQERKNKQNEINQYYQIEKNILFKQHYDSYHSFQKTKSLMKNVTSSQSKNNSHRNENVQINIIEKNQQTQLNIFITQIRDNQWKPQTREQVSCCVSQNKVYFYAGVGVEVYQDLNVWKFSSQKWKAVSQKDISLICPRHGHSMHSYKNKLFIFGGILQIKKMKAYTNDVIVFNLISTKWETCSTNNQGIDTRYKQASCILGRFMLIQGGINSKGKILNDFWAYDLQNNKWHDLPNMLFQYQHTITPVFDQDRKVENIILQRNLEIKTTSILSKEGLYIFNKKLSIITFDGNHLKMITAKTQGTPPQPRIQHTASYHMKSQFYIICGGKTVETRSFLNDIHILNLCTMSWMLVKQYGDTFKNRCGHNTVQINGVLLIFGGSNLEGYVNFDPVQIDFGILIFIKDQLIVSRKIEEKNQDDQMYTKQKNLSRVYLDIDI